MNAQQVVEKILSQAQAEADKIGAEANDKASAETASCQAEGKRFDDETAHMAAAAAKDCKDRMLAAARMENRKEFLAARVALLDEVFAEARRRILAMPDDAYQDLMIALMLRAVQTGDERILIGRGETRINDKMIKNVNRQLGPGFKGNIQLDPQRVDIDGGFLVRRGNIQVNVSVDVLIGQARQQLEMELANQVFGGS